MEQLQITPAALKGTIAAVPSKSESHRAILCALLSKGKCVLSPIDLSDDIKATLGAAQALGASYTYENGVLTLDASLALQTKTAKIDCCESGSTLRFMLAIAAGLGIETEFTGKGRLPQRPITCFYDLFGTHGAALSADHLPLRTTGRLTGGEYRIRGDISSQFITGLLFVLPVLKDDSRIILTTPLESKGYVDMTIRVLNRFGILIETLPDGYSIKGGQTYRPTDYQIEGDWSQAAFFLSAAALGGEITLTGLKSDSAQGDREIFDIMRRFGAQITETASGVTCKAAALRGITVDASQIPDLVPAIAVTAAMAKGQTVIHGAERLRIKESDRIQSVCAGLQRLGCDVVEKPDGMVITGSPLHTGIIDCENDHRIAMAFTMLLSAAQGGFLSGYRCINKSYPLFFEDVKRLGGNLHVLDR